LFAAAALAAVTSAHAQPAQPSPGGDATAKPPAKAPAKPPAGRTVEGVTVTGASQNGMRTSIDRRSYGVAGDLATTTGSISDALKNIPSVEVDVNGNVSLRGDTNVTILVDGKPSAMFRGASAAQALQAMPADSIERVEVITNPSAQFSPEGTAGIINLITKQVHRVGRSGSVRANLGSSGRRNVGLSGAYSSDKLTLSADAGARHDPQHSVSTEDLVTTDPVTGAASDLKTVNSFRGPLDQWNVRLAADYDLDAANRLSGELRYNNYDFHPDTQRSFRGFGPAGAPNLVLDEAGQFGQARSTGGGQLGYRRKFAGDDHTLVVSLSHEQTDEHNTNRFTTLFELPPGPDVFQFIDGRNTLKQTQLKADYSRPVGEGGRLKAGYDLRIDDNDYDNVAVRGVNAASAGPDPNQTNHFLYKQTVDAAYATYEQPFGAWTVLGGLRLEDVQLDLNQLTSRLASHQDYARLYPSLHAAYRLSDAQQLILSYSHRVQRPNPQDLNPFRFVGTLSARQGNPDLKPQQTDSYEAGWQYKAGAATYLATLYYRHNEHGVTDVVTDLGGGFLLSSKANLASSRNAGLELVANGRFWKDFSYNVSTNLYWNEIDASGVPPGPGLGFGATRSAFTVGGRGSLSWQATPKDLFQINVQQNAKRLLPQGFQDPMTLVFLGYRHKFDDSLSAVVTAQDPFDHYRFRQVLDSPGLHEMDVGRGSIRAVFVGLNWSFGAAQKRPPTFDFSPG